MKPFRSGKELAHIVDVACNRRRWSRSVMCYSWDKLMCLGNYTGKLVRRRIPWCDSVFVSKRFLDRRFIASWWGEWWLRHQREACQEIVHRVRQWSNGHPWWLSHRPAARECKCSTGLFGRLQQEFGGRRYYVIKKWKWLFVNGCTNELS